jgi:tetratricopeptide (TPR) repeat protein
MDKHVQRAEVLIGQGRYDLAEPELGRALNVDPDNGLLHALRAMCLCHREAYDEATDEAQTAIRLEPDLPFGHYQLAQVYLQRDWYDEAYRAIQEALRLEPDNPHHHGLLAAIWFTRRDWSAALDAAKEGLALDPEDPQCNNLRAMALTQLGRTAEAGATLASTLARDPENAFSHTNQGWRLLHEGDRQKAFEHFREALRLEPGMEFAQAGIVEAMKSKNVIYRLMLKYFLWMGRLSGTLQWVFILGFFIGARVLRAAAQQKPALAPYITPLLIAYMIFAVLSWIASPLFNLLLRLDKFGRHALSRDQIVASNWVGAIFFLALGGLLVWLITGEVLAFLVMAFFGFLLLPVSAIFKCWRGWPRRLMTLYTVGLAAAGIGFFVLAHLNVPEAILCMQVFLWGSVLSGFVGNALMMVTPRH